MNWLKLIMMLVSLVLEIVRYLERRELIKQVEASQLEALLERANEVAQEAINARAVSAADTSDESLFSDPNNRANWPGNIDSDTDADRSSDKKNGV
jgi:type II secretory pathway component PulM